MSVWVVMVAAGSGNRFGGPKQFEQLGDRRVIDWSIEVARSVADGLIVVIPPDISVDIDADVVATGGDTRAASVRAGLSHVPQDASVVLIHDAARPFASKSLYQSVIDAVEAGADGAIPGISVVDTIKRVAKHRVVETVDRSQLVAVQTPQAFKPDALRRGHASGPELTDDAAVVEAIGGNVVVVEGEQTNFKITLPRDLTIANMQVGA